MAIVDLDQKFPWLWTTRVKSVELSHLEMRKQRPEMLS